MEQARLWIKERAVFKGTFTRIHRFLEDERNAQDLSKVQIKYEQLVQTWNNYEDVQTKLEIHDETVNHEQDRIEIEDKVHELKARLKELLERRHEIVQPCSADGSREFRNKVKLPAIRLPQFEGQYEKWLSFSDTFKALVHNNTDVTTIQKYHYLLSTVSGQALQLISNLPITEDNYIIAWKLLGDRYSNKRLIASTHLREIFNIKPIYKESASEIIQFVNTATSNINALKALEIETPLQDILLTYFFTQRLDNNSRKEWELTLRDQSFPTLNNLFMFLEHKRQALENIISVDNSNIKYKETIEPKTKPGKIYQQRYSYIVADTTHCCYCNELHPLHKCSKFASLNVAGKQQFVRKHELCFNCLRTGHISVACKSGGCKKCNRRHHTLLHNEYQDTSAACTQERDSEQHHSNNTGYDESPTRNIENNKERENTYCALKSRMQSQVLLSTAIILVADSNGYLQPCRALLDSGSQAHFCTENLVQRLKFKKSMRFL